MIRSLFLLALLLTLVSCQSSFQQPPNIIWIVAEDISPAWGAYGDELATTPNLDALAAEGLLYRNAFANAPICAPARSTLVTGMYAPSLGTEHLRSEIPRSPAIGTFPEYLREAGYFVSNTTKTDYNFSPEGIWDYRKADDAPWRQRRFPGPPGRPRRSLRSGATAIPATPGGRPYFAMEHVKGEPIDVYCDKHRLRTGERLELFRHVCDGIQHAHQKAIIHRDVKPGNIMVGHREQGGLRAVVLDFGIARVAGSDPRLTVSGLVVGTPAYMAPEQVNGEPHLVDFGIARVTTAVGQTKTGTAMGTLAYMPPEQAMGRKLDPRTDIFSGGSVLYELLTGRRFFDVESHAELFGAVLEHMDYNIGKLVDLLEELDIAENTLVVFVSDNGGCTMEEGAAGGRFPGNNGPLRGGKATTYQGGLNVPLLMNWKGRLPQGMVSDDQVMHCDIFATLLDAAAIAVPAQDRPRRRDGRCRPRRGYESVTRRPGREGSESFRDCASGCLSGHAQGR